MDVSRRTNLSLPLLLLVVDLSRYLLDPTMTEPKGEKIEHPNGACFNTTLPAPLPDEYKEVAWAVPSFEKKTNQPKPIQPIWIARPKIAPNQVRFDIVIRILIVVSCGCMQDSFWLINL